MTKEIYTMVNVITFEVEGDRLNEVSNVKEAFAEGVARISQHEVTCINPDGTIHNNIFDTIALKEAIAYGLIEKG